MNECGKHKDYIVVKHSYYYFKFEVSYLFVWQNTQYKVYQLLVVSLCDQFIP